jgi:hypothetical protein
MLSWAAHPGRPDLVQDAAGQAALQQRHHLQLVLPDRLIGGHPGEPDGLQEAAQQLQGHPGRLADLPVGPPRAHRPAPVGGSLQEGERQPTLLDRRGDPGHRQPGPLAGGGQADLLHIGRQERLVAVAGDQDTELDQPLDLGLGHAGEVGQSRCRQPIHAAAILGPAPLLGEPCHPHRRGARCPHGQRAGRWRRHDPDDPRLGEPLCAACHDAQAQVLWNALAPELWRRTIIAVQRSLARQVGVGEAGLRRLVRVSYAKVAEFQKRARSTSTLSSAWTWQPPAAARTAWPHPRSRSRRACSRAQPPSGSGSAAASPTAGAKPESSGS